MHRSFLPAAPLGSFQKDMTQKVLAELTGTSVKFISDVERGKNSAQTDKVFDLLRALGLIVYIAQNPFPENKGDTR